MAPNRTKYFNPVEVFAALARKLPYKPYYDNYGTIRLWLEPGEKLMCWIDRGIYTTVFFVDNQETLDAFMAYVNDGTGQIIGFYGISTADFESYVR